MTKKEAILITNILNEIRINANEEIKQITFQKQNDNTTFEYIIQLKKITRRTYQKAKMTMSEDEIQYITRQFLKGKI